MATVVTASLLMALPLGAVFGQCEADEWGVCPNGSGPEPASFDEALACMDLAITYADFETYLDDIDPTNDANFICWIEHYWERHCQSACLCNPSCPGGDPWSHH